MSRAKASEPDDRPSRGAHRRTRLARRDRHQGAARQSAALGDARAERLAFGYLAMLPLLLAYEAVPHAARNVAEAVLSIPLAPFGARSGWIRLVILLLLAALCTAHLFRASLVRERAGQHTGQRMGQHTGQRMGSESPGLVPRLARIVFEGAVAALCLGPALLLLSAALGAEPAAAEFDHAHAGAGLRLSRAAFLAGGAAWEEILFRVGVQSLVALLASHTLSFLVESFWIVHAGSQVAGVLAGALVFAASHLAAFTQVLGSGGEEFHPAVFTWRVAAGILLGALYGWRGAGVAAWAHALFDLWLSIGAGPDVFL